MILVLNAIINIANIKKFSNEVFPRLNLGKYEERHLADNTIKAEDYSAMIITGSALSAADGSPSDINLFKLIESFASQEKPILGICWGHQMMARFFGGDDYVRHAPRPEFGWREIEIIRDDPVFDNISKPVFCETHFDEVCKINDDWKVLAQTDDCKYQSIRFGNGPFWGVQFHPEAFYEIATSMFENVIREFPEVAPFFKIALERKSDDAYDPASSYGHIAKSKPIADKFINTKEAIKIGGYRRDLKQNSKIFENFRELVKAD